VPYRGRTNEPAFVRHTAETLAEMLGLSFEDTARLTTANTLRLFAKAGAALPAQAPALVSA
jgi:TatD DNase family protein